MPLGVPLTTSAMQPKVNKSSHEKIRSPEVDVRL